MGKTTILRAVTSAAPPGMRLVQARGVEAEAEVGYATLADVLRPATGALDRLVPAQRAALESALALGPPSQADALMIGSAALSLLAAHAAAGPFAVLVDDLQFADAASQFVLAFIARRLESESIALVVSVRVGATTPLDAVGVEELVLEPLDTGPAAEIVTRVVPNVADAVRDRIVTTAEGNPLALVELPTLLDDEQLAGRRSLDDPLRVNGTVHAAFAQQLARLDDDARRALLLVSADDTAHLGVVRRAAVVLAVPDGAFERVEEAGVLELGPPLRIKHPLLRSLAYHAAPPEERRAVHAALAEATADDRYRQAWHRGLAVSDPDEGVAQALEAAAASVRARALYPAAAAAVDRAAMLSPSAEGHARRLVAAGSDHQLAGNIAAASERLSRALELTSDPRTRAEAHRLQVNAVLFGGDPRAAYALATHAAATLEEDHPDSAAVLLAQATMACQVSGEIRAGVECGRRAVEVARRAGPQAQLAANLALAEVLALAGDASGVRALQQEARSLLPFDDPLVAGQLLQSEAAYLMVIGEHEQAAALIRQIVAGARQAGVPGVLPYPLAVAAEIEFRTGRWPEALAAASEAVEIGEQTGQGIFTCMALIMLARIEAARGAFDVARGHLDRASAMSAALGVDATRFYEPAVRSFLELTAGRPEHAAKAGREVEELSAARGLREPAVVPWAPDLIEAYIRLDEPASARRVLERFEADAQLTGRVWADAAAARCRGLLEHDFEPEFDKAFGHHDQLTMPFERARTALALGERRRRAGRRKEAREPLEEALGAFRHLGAAPWGDRAERELRAAGGRPSTSPGETALAELTPHEVRVALIVAGGATNRDAAAELYVSPKTVDFHLQRIYRKLGVSSRTELAHLVRRVEVPTAP